MAYEQKTNQGAIFRNERKQQPNHPDYQGACEIGDPPVAYWVSCWSKESGPQSKNPGTRFLSLAFTPKDKPAGGTTTTTTMADDMAPTPIAAGATPAPAQARVAPPAAKSQVDAELDEANTPF